MLIFSSAFGRGQSAVIFDYEVTNDGGILFADEYERLGGVDTLGHPASYRFTLGDGFTYQVTQRALLQWRPEANAAYLGNIFQMLEQAGLDDWLLREKGIPLPIKDDGAGGDWNKAKEARLSWLTNERIKAKYLANPNPTRFRAGAWSARSSYTDFRCRGQRGTDRSSASGSSEWRSSSGLTKLPAARPLAR